MDGCGRGATGECMDCALHHRGQDAGEAGGGGRGGEFWLCSPSAVEKRQRSGRGLQVVRHANHGRPTGGGGSSGDAGRQRMTRPWRGSDAVSYTLHRTQPALCNTTVLRHL